jgi:DNA polymerase-3 subunit alpha
MKVLVKEGWTDRDTGKKGEPIAICWGQTITGCTGNFARKLVVLWILPI